MTSAPRPYRRASANFAIPLASLSCLLGPSPPVCAEEPDSTQLIGSWRWIWSGGGQLGGRIDPTSCEYERILTLKPDGIYEFVEQDSANEYLLCKGAARKAKIQGTVILHVLVGKDGHVKHVQVIRAVAGLTEAAVEAVKKWVFRPALSNNKPVAVWVEVPIHFPP